MQFFRMEVYDETHDGCRSCQKMESAVAPSQLPLRRRIGYTSLQCAEVYLGETGCILPCDKLPFRADKFPQVVKE